PRLKRRLGQAAYAAAAVETLALASRRAPVLRVTVDDDPPVVVRSLVVVCASPYAWLGPRPLDLVPGPAHAGPLAWLGLLRARPRGREGRAGRARGEGHGPGRAPGPPGGSRRAWHRGRRRAPRPRPGRGRAPRVARRGVAWPRPRRHRPAPGGRLALASGPAG